MRKRTKEEMGEFRMSEVGGMRQYPVANPETDAARFAAAVEEAHEFAKRSNYDVIVFKNKWGFYLVRELKFSYIDIRSGAIEPLYCAPAALNVTKGSLKRSAWKRQGDGTHRTR